MVPQLNPWTIVEGRAPQRTQEIIIDKGSANDGDFTVGQQVKVLLKGPTQEMTIVGIAKFGSTDSPAGATFVGFDYNTAQKLLAEPGQIDSISAVADPGVSQSSSPPTFRRPSLPHTEVLTGEQITKENQSDIKKGLSFFNTFLLVFADVSLFVGMFIIYNTFSIIVAQRSKELALAPGDRCEPTTGAHVGARRRARGRADRVGHRPRPRSARRGRPEGVRSAHSASICRAGRSSSCPAPSSSAWSSASS